MNSKRYHSSQILNDGRSALFEENKSVSVMEHAVFRGKCKSTVRAIFDSQQQQKKFNDTYDYLVLFNLH